MALPALPSPGSLPLPPSSPGTPRSLLPFTHPRSSLPLPLPSPSYFPPRVLSPLHCLYALLVRVPLWQPVLVGLGLCIVVMPALCGKQPSPFSFPSLFPLCTHAYPPPISYPPAPSSASFSTSTASTAPSSCSSFPTHTLHYRLHPPRPRAVPMALSPPCSSPPPFLFRSCPSPPPHPAACSSHPPPFSFSILPSYFTASIPTKISYTFSKYYELSNCTATTCFFSGNATINSAASTSTVSNAISACLMSPSAVFMPTSPSGSSGSNSGGSGSSGSGGSGSGMSSGSGAGSTGGAKNRALARLELGGLMGGLVMVGCVLGGMGWTLSL
ncbi:hypothetical protein C8R44DRAFT_877752 [Mycena epipterygia]|nr:hypothetical protein C8R44DRAFT_877752 [Mycena epipterygia]